ncbi:MAG: TrkH family potassium uptake protein [archaeon]|nr:TrkH family potassium uptake protein [archaeon]
MFSNLKTVLKDLGSILVILGLLMLVLMIVSYIFKEFDVLSVLFFTMFFTLCFGLLLRYSCRNAKEPELKHALITAASAWLVVPAISSLFFIFIEGMHPLDSFFEGMSGWTGTGLTMIAHPSSLTFTMQFWRSLMQWVGGIGVIVLMVSILARPGTGSFMMYKAETREEKIRPSVISTVRIIWWIYLLLTSIGIVLFYFAGMALWEAINHAMTAIGTGGFSVTENSMAFYRNPVIELAIIPMMILGAIPFLIHYRVLTGNLRAFLKDMQCRALFIILLLLLIPLLIENYVNSYGDMLSSLRFSSFQLISGLTCTGFQTYEVHLWSGTALGIVSIAMLIGGGAGSTAGGIKLIRAVLVWKGMSWSLTRSLLPKRAIKPFRFGDRLLNEDETNRIVSEANLIIILWLVFLFVGVVVLSHVVVPSHTLGEIIFEVASAQGNVGLSVGITGAGMSYIGKVMLILNMWIGRLEIIPVLMLFRAFVKGLEPI